MSLDDLPTELKLNVLSFASLSSLISLRQTSRYFFNLVNDSLKSSNVINPSRTKLLRLYLDLHHFKSFRASRPYVRSQIRAFSREEYLSSIQQQLTAGDVAASIPVDFRTWILEWPENAVVGWAWPGLDGAFDADVCPRNSKVLNPFERGKEHWWRTYGSNMLQHLGISSDSSILGPLLRKDRPMLLIQDHGFDLKSYLVLDTGGDCSGQVWCEGMDDQETVQGNTPSKLGTYQVVTDWVDWLYRELRLIEILYAGKKRMIGQISEKDILRYIIDENLPPPK